MISYKALYKSTGLLYFKVKRSPVASYASASLLFNSIMLMSCKSIRQPILYEFWLAL